MELLQQILARSSSRHSHMCPRQVLGARMGLAGAQILGMELPRNDKAMLVIAETDGCFLDGIEAATGLTPGHRTLRIVDYGKVAATFIEVRSGAAVRLAPRPTIRQDAIQYAPDETRHYFTQLRGYQLIPLERLFTAAWVTLNPSAKVLISRPGVRTICSSCGEEIINEREVVIDDKVYCQSCCGPAYYHYQSAECPVDFFSNHVQV